MWLIEGPFDGKTSGELEFKKLKLLKPGHTYLLGRKAKQPTQLVISHPKVSAEHVSFTVAEHATDDVSNHSIIPALILHNLKNKAIHLMRRGTERLQAEPLKECKLEDGDTIALVTGVYITAHWRPVCCYAPPKTPKIPFDQCASLGIKVVATPRQEVTHHLTPMLNLSTSIATSMLIPAQLVRPDWLTEFLRLGELVKEDGSSGGFASLTALEFEYTPPAEVKHRPSFAPTLPPVLKTFKTWEANPARAQLLVGWRLVFLGEKGRELDTEMRELVDRGGGEYEAFDIAGGPKRLQQTIARNVRKVEKGIAVIGKSETLKIGAGATWADMLEALNSSELRIIERTKLLEAVVYIDTSRIESTRNVINSNSSSSTSIPESVPNTNLEELPGRTGSELRLDGVEHGANGQSSRTRPRKRVTPASRAPSEHLESAMDSRTTDPAPTPKVPLSADDGTSRQSVEPETVPARRKLVRRVRADTKQILGVDDPSILDDASQDEPSSAPNSALFPEPSAVPQLLGRSNRLKRRLRSETPSNPIIAALEKESEDLGSQPPPLKRFKALFDETDPDRVASQGPMTMSAAYSGGIIEDDESQLFSQMRTETAGAGSSVTRLQVVPEGEEGIQSGTARSITQSKHGPSNEGELLMESVEGTLSSRSPHVGAGGPSVMAASQRPTHFSSADQPGTSRKGSKSGAAPGQPDTDDAFLKALASTKKGKRREDDFDREFNNLRISKPDLDKEQLAQDWAVLEDFGDESNLMGNFMVIEEMDVPDKRSRVQSTEPETRNWQGKPNFKAFKKKPTFRQRPAVELVVEDENDYGMGSTYWKGGSQSQSQSQAISQGEALHHLQPSQTQNRGFLQSAPSSKSQATMKARSQSSMQSRAASHEPRKARSRGLRAQSEASDVEDVARFAKGKQKERLGSVMNGKANGEDQPLFLDAVEEEEMIFDPLANEEVFDLDIGGSDDDPGEAPTLRSTNPRTAKAKPASSSSKRNKRPAALLDDDSDTGMTFKGFAGRKKAKAK